MLVRIFDMPFTFEFISELLLTPAYHLLLLWLAVFLLELIDVPINVIFNRKRKHTNNSQDTHNIHPTPNLSRRLSYLSFTFTYPL